MKKVIAYQTDDGKLFLNEHEAEWAEDSARIDAFCREFKIGRYPHGDSSEDYGTRQPRAYDWFCDLFIYGDADPLEFAIGVAELRKKLHNRAPF